MHDNRTKSILESLQQGQISVDDALLQLKLEPFQDLGYARVDHHRRLRQGAGGDLQGQGRPRSRWWVLCRPWKRQGRRRCSSPDCPRRLREIVGKPIL